jgi:cell wall-associated NlpC family hydrolase
MSQLQNIPDLPKEDASGSDGVERPQGVNASGQPLRQDGEHTSATTATAEAAAAGPSPGLAISRSTIVARAQVWLHPPVPYSQNHFKDGYRTDCSGYVSMSWETHGNYWTGNLHTIATAIAYQDLQPGDMLLHHNTANPVNGSHVVLFERWVKEANGDFWIYEQTPSATKHHLWSQTGYSRQLYKPFRYRNLRVAPAPK